MDTTSFRGGKAPWITASMQQQEKMTEMKCKLIVTVDGADDWWMIATTVQWRRREGRWPWRRWWRRWWQNDLKLKAYLRGCFSAVHGGCPRQTLKLHAAAGVASSCAARSWSDPKGGHIPHGPEAALVLSLAAAKGRHSAPPWVLSLRLSRSCRHDRPG